MYTFGEAFLRGYDAQVEQNNKMAELKQRMDMFNAQQGLEREKMTQDDRQFQVTSGFQGRQVAAQEDQLAVTRRESDFWMQDVPTSTPGVKVPRKMWDAYESNIDRDKTYELSKNMAEAQLKPFPLKNRPGFSVPMMYAAPIEAQYDDRETRKMDSRYAAIGRFVKSKLGKGNEYEKTPDADVGFLYSNNPNIVLSPLANKVNAGTRSEGILDYTMRNEGYGDPDMFTLLGGMWNYFLPPQDFTGKRRSQGAEKALESYRSLNPQPTYVIE